MTSHLARTALDLPAAPSGLTIRLGEAPLRGMLVLKGDLASANIRAAVTTVTGLQPPGPRRGVRSGEHGVFWMAPDELLLMTPYAQTGAALDAVAAAVGSEPHLAQDVSDARAVFRLVGADARGVLAKGAPFDLHADAFGLGDVRRTRIGPVAAAIALIEAEPETFEVLCFRSYAPHLWRWLVTAASAPAPMAALGVDAARPTA